MRGFLRTAFALAHVAVAGAIFEDQAGAFDWHQEHIGEAAIVKYEGARAYVGTTGGVVAALNVRTGATAWRYVLPDGELVDQLVLLPKLRGLLLLSGGGKHWQVLGAKSGQLVCEGMTYFGKAARGKTDAVALGEGGGSGKVALLGGNRVFLIDTAKCAQVWSFAPPKGQGGAAAVRLEALSAAAGGEGSVQALGRTAAAAVVTELDAGKGSVLATKTHKMDGGGGGGGGVAEGVWIVRPGSAGKAPTLITLDGDSLVATDAVGGEAVRTPLAKLGLSGGDAAAGAVTLEAVATGLDASASGLVALRSAAAVAVAAVEPSLAAKEFKSYASGGGGGDAGARRLFALAAPSPSFPEAHRGGAVLLTVATAGEAGAEVEAFAAADGASLAKQTWPTAGPLSAGARGGAVALFPALYIVKRDGSLGVRALLRTVDHGLTMLQPKRAATDVAGGGAWSREEALSSAVQVLFTDARPGHASAGGGGPPGSSAAAAAAAQLPGFAGRLALQLKLAAGVPATLATAVGAAAKTLSSLGGGGAGAKGRDSSALEFGKTILIMTKPGKLFALRGATGEVLWSRMFSASASASSSGAPPQLFEAGASEVLVADVGAATALWLDASSGKTLRSAPFPAGTASSIR